MRAEQAHASFISMQAECRQEVYQQTALNNAAQNGPDAGQLRGRVTALEDEMKGLYEAMGQLQSLVAEADLRGERHSSGKVVGDEAPSQGGGNLTQKEPPTIRVP